MIRCQVLIIGNGLAALSLGILLNQKGIHCILLNKKTQQQNLQSTWTENVQPDFLDDCVKRLDYLFDENLLFPCVQKISAWGTSFAETHSGELSIQISKNAFIDSLMNHAQHCGTIILDRTLHSTPKLDKKVWSLQLLEPSNNQVSELTADIIIDASGRNGVIANKYFTHRQYHDDHIAIFQSLKANESRYHSEMVIESAEHGWWYILGEDKHTLVAYITNGKNIHPKEYAKLFEQQLKKSYYAKAAYSLNQINAETIQVRDCRTGIEIKTAETQWACIGDAAFSTDPLGGHGNQITLDSALKACEAICNFFVNGHSLLILNKINQDLFNAHLANRKSYYSLEKRWLKNHFWNNIIHS